MEEMSAFTLVLPRDLQFKSTEVCQEMGYDKTKILKAVLIYVTTTKRIPRDLLPYVMWLDARGRRSIKKVSRRRGDNKKCE